MRRLLFFLFSFPLFFVLKAQDGGTAKDSAGLIYRAAFPHINDLVHTKLDVRFDYKKRHMYGKEWVTLRPHFYPTDTLRLDAKGMDIHKVAIVKDGKMTPLKYDYDSMVLKIHLDKAYKYTDKYTIFIDYTSKPNELKVQGSAAITDAKGLYFINPKGEDKDKPTQIWTQGETEANSAWFPTIDKPNQKTTEEITMPCTSLTSRCAIEKRLRNSTPYSSTVCVLLVVTRQLARRRSYWGAVSPSAEARSKTPRTVLVLPTSSTSSMKSGPRLITACCGVPFQKRPFAIPLEYVPARIPESPSLR